MKHSSLHSGFPAGNPIANLFVIVVGALAIGASIVLGFFAFVIVGSLVLIMASVIALRLWWFKRKFGRRGPASASRDSHGTDGVIEGEYQVVADEDKDE